MENTDRRIRVVVVDDDPEIRTVLEAELQDDAGIELVASGQNGREAIQLANRYRPDVMILDIHMPLMDGLEAGARIARAFPAIGIVILSSDQSLPAIKTAFLEARALAHLNKATDISRIVETVREADAKRDLESLSRGIAAIWSFYGPLGRAGTTTLAVNTAFELAELGYRTLLVDLDMLHGSCAFDLGLSSSSGQADRSLFTELFQVEKLDHDSLRSYIRKPVAAPGIPEIHLINSPCTYVPDSAAAGEKLKKCFDVWEETYDYIILDVPSGRLLDEINVIALELSERMFVTCHPDLKGLKGLWELVRILREVSFTPDRMTLLVSSMIKDLRISYPGWLEKRGIEHRSCHEVPRDVTGCTRALDAGRPVLFDDPSSSLSRFIKDIVLESLNFPPAERESKSFWGRLTGAFRR